MMDLFDCLSADVLVIFAYAAPFLEKWTKRSKDMHSVFGVPQPFGGSCSKLQSVFCDLYLLKATLIEQRDQVSSYTVTFLREEASCPEQGA